VLYLCAEKTGERKALIAATSCSNHTKSYGMILNSFIWPPSGK